MKNKFFLPALLAIGLFACRKESVTDDITADQAITDPGTLYNKLQDIGFPADRIKDLGKYYLVDGDLLFDKERTDLDFLDTYFNRMKKGANTSFENNRHWITPGIVSTYNIENMKIETDEYFNNGEITDWRRSAATAMGHWAGISNTLINFTRYFNQWSGPGYINITDDGGALPNNVIAAAEFPSSGSPGFQIRVNLDFNSNANVPAGQRVYNLAHELGHCFGFRHTNWQLLGEGQSGAIAITATSASQDPNSVMNGGTANNSWNGFSPDDVIAAQAVYPVGTYSNWITSPNGGKYPSYAHYYVYDGSAPITITWNSSLVNTSTVTLQVYQKGTLRETLGTSIPNTGSYVYPVNLSVLDGNHDFYEVQFKITSNANPSITDFSSMFDFVYD